MRKPRKIDFEKEQYWRTVLYHFQNSGLSFKKFCQQEKISPNTFQYWRKVLRDRDAERGSGQRKLSSPDGYETSKSP